ncbi:MAG: hypothetical protein AAFX79_10605 [Planctomycetota bacterium]
MPRLPSINDRGIDSIAQLREWRTRSRDVEIRRQVRRAAARYQATARTGDRLADAWAELAPLGISSSTSAEGVVRGVLAVRVRDAADQHEASRWLRGGGALALQRAIGQPIRRWRFEFGDSTPA